jgi:hypothetical protein
MTFKPYALPIVSTVVELSPIELDRVTGGVTPAPAPTPPTTGNLRSDVLRLFTDAANGARKRPSSATARLSLATFLTGAPARVCEVPGRKEVP